MHSAHYAVARCLPVRLSVRHTPVLSLNGYDILKVFTPSGSPTILVFPYQTECQYSDGDLLTGASNARGSMKKITIFDQYRALSRN